MKKIYLLIGISCLFANELEVDGSLKVSGGVDVQGNVISNVGDPVNPTDAMNLTSVGGVVSNMMSLAGMTPPERIYNYIREEDTAFNFSVPSDKAWLISISNNTRVDVDGVSLSDINKPVWLFPNQTLSMGSGVAPSYEFVLMIYEYSFTSSGTDQGMDYIVP